MNLKEYQQQTKRTFAFRKEPLNTTMTDMLHCAIGICSEQGEMLEAINKGDLVNIGEEIADQMWYISNLATFQDFCMCELVIIKTLMNPSEKQAIDNSIIYSSELIDFFKKSIFYNRELDKAKVRQSIHLMTQNLSDLCLIFDIDFEKILNNNIAKLRIRFPEKFTNELAENRDLESERKELEK